ncbi:MAG: ATP-grasp domain-containing protein [Solirubrobacterales bacterium]|nr:ATP-grasp domain-containing protein [Solirubrobacterales bacterium]
MGKRPRVLITGMGGPAGVSVLRGIAGDPFDVYSADIDPFAAGLYLVPPERRIMLPRGDSPRFVDTVIGVCGEHAIDVLVPTVDSELLPVAKARVAFEAANVALVNPSADTLRMCLDKWELHQRCAGVVRVPASAVLNGDFDPAAVALPVIVKPRSGSGSRGIRLISDRNELENVAPDGTQLVQEYLPGPEHSLDVLARRDGRVLAVVPRERLKVDSGIAVTARVTRDEALESFGRAVAERIGLVGVGNVQVKQAAGGEPALLEVNPRFPGSMPLTIAAGVNMPALAIREALGEPMPDDPIDFRPLAMVRLLEDRFLDFEEIAVLQERVDA